MKYQLTIQSDDLQELVDLLQGASGTKAETSVPVKETKKQKAKPKPEPEPEEEEEEEEEDDLVGEDDDDDDQISFEELQVKVSEKAQAGLRDKVKKLLTKYGAAK